MASRMLLGLAVLGIARRARAEPPPARRPAPKEDLSAEDEALLDVIDLLWDMPLLEEWNPEEDAPDPIEDPAPPQTGQVRAPEPPRRAAP